MRRMTNLAESEPRHKPSARDVNFGLRVLRSHPCIASGSRRAAPGRARGERLAPGEGAALVGLGYL